jgi:hypothetical protein
LDMMVLSPHGVGGKGLPGAESSCAPRVRWGIWSKVLLVPVLLVLYIITTASYSSRHSVAGRSPLHNLWSCLSEMGCATGLATDSDTVAALARACVTSVPFKQRNFSPTEGNQAKKGSATLFRQFS